MKKKKILFIASLPTKKFNFDGERNKSRDILNALKQTDKYRFSVIDLSKNKIFQMIKLVILHLFKKYNYIFVSKCIVGGSLALHIINKINKHEKKYFYIVGNGDYGLKDKHIYYEDIKICDHIIIESEEVKQSFINLFDLDKMHIFPCLKPYYELDVVTKDYKPNQPLKLIYFSRINPDKGLGDLLEVVIKINSKFEKPILYLDVSGGVSNEPGIKEFNEKVKKICESHSYLNYLGMSLRINGIESYKQLQNYDLHVFPSRFKQECAPGSILDMFLAGVPTLSAKFPSYSGLLSENDSFLFEQNNLDDLETKLIYVYNNSYLLNDKRINSHSEYYKYTDKAFISFLKGINLN